MTYSDNDARVLLRLVDDVDGYARERWTSFINENTMLHRWVVRVPDRAVRDDGTPMPLSYISDTASSRQVPHMGLRYWHACRDTEANGSQV
jgi:hypothetical protein